MASTTPHLQHPLCLTRNAVRGLGLLAALFGGVTVSAVEHPESTAQSHSYVVEVPVVSAKAIEVTRTVERPIKTCERVGYSARPREESLSVHRYSRYNGPDRRSRDGQRQGGGVGAQILGGLIGGAIGNQFGGGKGKKALTIAGALIGSSIARGGQRRLRRDDYDDYVDQDFVDDDYFESRPARHARDREYQPEYACRTTRSTREVTEVTGFDVTYRYNETLHKRRMDHDPGDTLKLRVHAVPDVAPAVAES